MRSSSLVLSASILGLCFTAACGGAGSAGDQTSTATGSGGESSSTAGGASTSSASGSGGAPCAAGTIQCAGNVQNVCDGNGGFVTTDCGMQVCVPALGCLACAPGTGSCAGNLGSYCLGDGTGFATETCDPVQGTTCNAQTGHCDGA